MKAAGPETGHGLHQLEAGAVRHHGEVICRTERRVREERGLEIWSALRQIPSDEGQVVVVHDDGRTCRGLLRDRVGKGLVEQAVPSPCLVPDAVETWATRMVEQPVVQEPQGPVRDHVYGRSPDLGRDGDHAQLERVLSGGHRDAGGMHAICLGHGCRDPECRAARRRRLLTQCGGQAGRHTPSGRSELDSPVGTVHEGERSPVGDDDEAEPGHATRSPARRSATSSTSRA